MNAIGILPAAGFAKRLSIPYPKELLPITYNHEGVITVLETSLIQLREAGIEEAVIVIRSEKEMIKRYLGQKRWGIELTYVYQTDHKSREGLPDAIMAAYDYCKSYDLCVMLMPDVYFTASLITKNLVNKLQEYSDAIAAVSVWETDQPERFGIVGYEGEFAKYVVDKPQYADTNTHWGAVAFHPDFWKYISAERDTLSNSLNLACPHGVVVSEAYGDYLDLGTPVSLIDGIVKVNS